MRLVSPVMIAGNVDGVVVGGVVVRHEVATDRIIEVKLFVRAGVLDGRQVLLVGVCVGLVRHQYGCTLGRWRV